LNVEQGNHTFVRFYDFLDTVAAHALIPRLPAPGQT